MIRTLTCIVLVSAAAFTAQSASAAQRTPEQAVVSTRGLDLNSAADQRTLSHRIRGVAQSVCTSEGARDLQTEAADAACESKAVADAMRALNMTSLSQRATADARVDIAAVEAADSSR